MKKSEFCDIISDILIWFFKISYYLGYAGLTLFAIFLIYSIVAEYNKRIIVTEKVTLKGVVVDSGCIEKYTNHLSTNYKTYYSVCRLKVKWENNTETTYNYRFPALVGECVEQYDRVAKYYYFGKKTPDSIEKEHFTRLCKDEQSQ